VALDGAPCGVLITDTAGRCLDGNRVAAEMTGRPQGELGGIALAGLLSTGAPGAELPDVDLLLEASRSPLEVACRRADGSVRWWELRASRLDEGRHLVFLTDVTERRQASTALAHQTRLRQLLLKLATHYIDLSPERFDHAVRASLAEMGALIGADRAYLFRYDLSRQVAVNTHEWCAPGISPYIHELQAVALEPMTAMVRAHRDGRPFAVPCVADLRDPRFRSILEQQEIQSLLAVPLMDGSHCRGFVGFDAVRRSRPFADEDLQLLSLFATMLVGVQRRLATEEALRESESRFRTMCDDFTHVAIQAYGPDGTTQYWNRGSEELYGYTREEALGRNLLDLIIPAEMRERVRAAMEGMAATGEPIPSAELRLRRKDGTPVDVYSSHWIVRRRRGDQELFCVDIDLSEVRRAERERQALEERLRVSQHLESLGRLAGGVAHDVNNMLGIILGNTDLCLAETPGDAPMREWLEEARGGATRSAALIRQLLAFARKQDIEPQVLDLNESLGASAGMLRRLIGENVRLEWSPGEDVPPVRVDPAQLEQILANLVVNARDAIEGTGTIHIETGDHRVRRRPSAEDADIPPGRYASLVVRDDGRGIEPGSLERIFEPFYTTKALGRGTGLGLSTVYGAVRQNGGVVDVASEVGRGTRFRVLLPAYRAPGETGNTRDGSAPGA
jgi:PAS domain S-box-containing protein